MSREILKKIKFYFIRNFLFDIYNMLCYDSDIARPSMTGLAVDYQVLRLMRRKGYERLENDRHRL